MLTQLNPLEEGLRKNLTHSLLSKIDTLIRHLSASSISILSHSVKKRNFSWTQAICFWTNNDTRWFLHPSITGDLIELSAYEAKTKSEGQMARRARKGRLCWTFTHFCFLRIYASRLCRKTLANFRIVFRFSNSGPRLEKRIFLHSLKITSCSNFD